MNIAFTLCSNNYLAHAKTLGDSFLKYHPDFTFVIGLVDKYTDELDYSIFSKFTIILVEDINVTNFAELNSKYSISELNTAVKPSYFHYLFKNYQAQNVIYIDPDILVTSRFEEVINMLTEKNIIITPHTCTPIDDEFTPTDYHTLRGGVFNLGFIALSKYQNVSDFLNWWHARVVKYGFNNFSVNMFYDQLWINYVPCFYDNYYILKHLGYNMANWNLHERYLEATDGNYIINKNYQLRFFHFSSYHFDNPTKICSYLTRYNFINRPDLQPLFDLYNKLLKENFVEKIKKMKVYYYPELGKPLPKKSLAKRISKRIQITFKFIITGNV